MKIKFLLIATFVLTISVSHAQIILKIPEKQRPVLHIDATPLLIINGRPSVGNTLNNFYFDTSNITRLEFIKPENNAVKLYGTAAAHGVILVETKRKTEWISTIDLFNSLVKDSSYRYEDIVFSLDHKLFIPHSILYFDKTMIKEATFKKDSTFLANKWFQSIISIEVTK